MTPAAQSDRGLWRELAAALLLIWLPWFVLGITWHVGPRSSVLRKEFLCMALEAVDIALILWWFRRNGESWRSLGIRKVRWWTELLWSVGIYAAEWMAWFLLDPILMDLLGPPSDTSTVGRPRGLLFWLLPFFLLLSAFFEELFFRGYLWIRLRRLTGGRLPALALSTLLFTVYHPYPSRDLVYIGVFGLVLGFFFWTSRSLPRLVLAHTWFNLSIYYHWT
jgi:membrane protease YdiL (CAAX protease family)